MNENKTNINCDTGILGKIHSNYWKHSLFKVEIFTFLVKNLEQILIFFKLF